MTTTPSGLQNNRTSPRPELTTMPSHSNIRNPNSGMNMPFPRPTVSLDPRPVVIPILSSVIGFPIVVFALICALRHRAIKLRRRDHLKKLQSGIRSVTLDIPPRDKASFFSGCSSPDMSIKEVGDRLESINLKPSLSVNKKPSSKNNNHVKFMTPPTDCNKPPNNLTTVEVLLHADNSGVEPKRNGSTVWHTGQNSIQQLTRRNMEVEPEICPIDQR